jgi:hypothetical protein
MTAFLEVLTAIAALCLAWWLLRRLLRPKAPADPAEDPFSFVPGHAEWGLRENLVRSHSKNRRRTIQLTPSRHVSCRRLRSLVLLRDSVSPW